MKVSVITAFYKGNKYMPSYVKCMLANADNMQRCGHELEVIVVNDSPGVEIDLLNDSSDNQRELLKDGSNKEDEHVNDALLQHVNCILEWQSKLDEINKNMSQELQQTETIQKMYNPVSVSNASLEQADGTALSWYRTDYHKGQIGKLSTYIKVGNQIISPGQCLIPRQFVPRIWTERICKENGSDDYYLWLVMLALRHHFILVDEPLYTHKYTGANISADTTNTDVSTYEFVDFLRDADYFSQRDIDKLLRMNKNKAGFRASNKVKKILLSLRNMDIFLANVFYKIKTKTPMGFNR